MPTYTLSALTVFLLLLFGVYMVHQARRRRESEMAFKLRKCEIALQDAEHALSNTVDYYKGEVARLEQQLSGRETSARGSDEKFRRANPLLPGVIIRIAYPATAKKRGSAQKFFKDFWEELQGIEAGNR